VKGGSGRPPAWVHLARTLPRQINERRRIEKLENKERKRERGGGALGRSNRNLSASMNRTDAAEARLFASHSRAPEIHERIIKNALSRGTITKRSARRQAGQSH